MTSRVRFVRWVQTIGIASLFALVGCGGDDSESDGSGGDTGAVDTTGVPVVTGNNGQQQNANTGADGAQDGTGANAGSAAAGGGSAMSGTDPAGGTSTMGGTDPAGGGAGMGMDMSGMDPGGNAMGGGSMSATDPDPFTGPEDGDPNTPMVTIPDVGCGNGQVSFAGSSGNMVTIGGREVFVAYPCAHEGAAVTFFLFIHGTLGEGQKIPFTLNAFPIHTRVESDNFIVVAPQAVGSQWGNGDNGVDLPHLYEVIDWVYANFGEKFNIRSMWASGGSWGAFYLSRFACDPMLEGRLSGVRMVVGGGCPSCSGRLACIVAQQELELGGGEMLTDAEKEMRVQAANVEPYAQMHGCGPREGPTNYGPVRAWTWPNCDTGFAHSYYLGPGQHADPWNDPTALDHMIAELKSIEP